MSSGLSFFTKSVCMVWINAHTNTISRVLSTLDNNIIIRCTLDNHFVGPWSPFMKLLLFIRDPCTQSKGVVTVMCTNEYINPLGLTTDEVRNDQEGDPTVSMGNGRRRKRRSTVKRTLRKRQDVPSSDEAVSQNITLVSVRGYCRFHSCISWCHEKEKVSNTAYIVPPPPPKLHTRYCFCLNSIVRNSMHKAYRPWIKTSLILCEICHFLQPH